MQYLLLIYDDEDVLAAYTEEQTQNQYQQHMDLTADMKENGVFVGGAALEPTSTATTVRIQADGKALFTDGPFAETKERLGGYYLVDCTDLDDALSWAARIPMSGSVEVRPLMVSEDVDV